MNIGPSFRGKEALARLSTSALGMISSKSDDMWSSCDESSSLQMQKLHKSPTSMLTASSSSISNPAQSGGSASSSSSSSSSSGALSSSPSSGRPRSLSDQGPSHPMAPTMEEGNSICALALAPVSSPLESAPCLKPLASSADGSSTHSSSDGAGGSDLDSFASAAMNSGSFGKKSMTTLTTSAASLRSSSLGTDDLRPQPRLRFDKGELFGRAEAKAQLYLAYTRLMAGCTGELQQQQKNREDARKRRPGGSLKKSDAENVRQSRSNDVIGIDRPKLSSPASKKLESADELCSRMQVLLIHGESGVGKTALITDWKSNVLGLKVDVEDITPETTSETETSSSSLSQPDRRRAFSTDMDDSMATLITANLITTPKETLSSSGSHSESEEPAKMNVTTLIEGGQSSDENSVSSQSSTISVPLNEEPVATIVSATVPIDAGMLQTMVEEMPEELTESACPVPMVPPTPASANDPLLYIVSSLYQPPAGVMEPFLAIKLVMEQLVQQVLKTEGLSEELQSSVQNALSHNLASTLLPVLPSLRSLMIGVYDTIVPPEAEAPEDQRFDYHLKQLGLGFFRLLRALARPSHPIVIILDELQWADEESLRWIAMISRQCRHLLLVGSFRSATEGGPGNNVANVRKYFGGNMKDRGLSMNSSSSCNITGFSWADDENSSAGGSTGSPKMLGRRRNQQYRCGIGPYRHKKSSNIRSGDSSTDGSNRSSRESRHSSHSDDFNQLGGRSLMNALGFTRHIFHGSHEPNRQTSSRSLSPPPSVAGDAGESPQRQASQSPSRSKKGHWIPRRHHKSSKGSHGSPPSRSPSMDYSEQSTTDSRPGLDAKEDSLRSCGNQSTTADQGHLPERQISKSASSKKKGHWLPRRHHKSSKGSHGLPPAKLSAPDCLEHAKRSDSREDSSKNSGSQNSIWPKRSSSSSSGKESSSSGGFFSKAWKGSKDKRYSSKSSHRKPSFEMISVMDAPIPESKELSVPSRASEPSNADTFGNINVGFHYIEEPESNSINVIQHHSHQSLVEIQLTNLKVSDVNEMIADAMKTDPGKTMDLAEVVVRKTHGNPEAIIHFVEALRQEGLLLFSHLEFCWKWDAKMINDDTTVTANVVELVANRIKQMGDYTKSFLQLAAISGFSFRKDIVLELAYEEKIMAKLGTGKSRASRNYLRKFEHAIEEAITAGIIRKETDAMGNARQYLFIHDRIRDSFLSSLMPEERTRLHLATGRLMRANVSLGTDEKWLLATTNQLNQGSELITDCKERVELMALNLSASRKAKSSLSLLASMHFLEAGTKLVDESTDWDSHYALVLEIYTCTAEVAVHVGYLDFAVELAEKVKHHGKDVKDWIRCSLVIVDVLGIQGDFSGAFREGRRSLKQLGYSIPKKARKSRIVMNLLRIRRLMAQKSSADLIEMRTMTDDLCLCAMRLLDSLSLIAWMSGQDSFVSMVMTKMMIMTLKHGCSLYAPVALASYGMLLSHYGNTKQAYKFGNLALNFADRIQSKLSLTRTALVVYTFTHHLRNPLIDSVEPMLNAHRIGLEIGEVDYSSMCVSQYSALYISVGLPLGSYAEDMKAFCEQLEMYNQEQYVALIKPFWQLSLNLIGRSEDPLVLTGEAMNEAEFLEMENDEDDGGVAIVNARFVLLLLAYIFQDSRLVERRFREAQSTDAVVTGTHFLTYLDVLLSGLAAFSIYRSTGRRRFYAQGRKFKNVMKELVKRCGLNCHAMYLLLTAEKLSFVGSIEEVHSAYDEAITCFARIGTTHLEAIACERAGDYMESQRDRYWARAYYGRAIERYTEWGAVAKADQLRRIHDIEPEEEGSSVSKPSIKMSIRGRRRYDPSTWSTIMNNSSIISMKHGRESD